MRSPLFFIAAAVIVAVVLVVDAFNSEGWVEVGPIPVLQEREVMYVEDEGIFVFWNDREPYGVLEDVAHAADERAVFCAPDAVFLGHHGEVFDVRGGVVAGPVEKGLVVLPTRMDGHDIFVATDGSEAEGAGRSSTGSPDRPSCSPPQGDERGIVHAE